MAQMILLRLLNRVFGGFMPPPISWCPPACLAVHPLMSLPYSLDNSARWNVSKLVYFELLKPSPY